MTDPDPIDAIARRAGARLVDIDPALPDAVDQALTADPLAAPANRLLDPISLGALIVGIAQLGWSIYHDTKNDRAADQPLKTQSLYTLLEQDAKAVTGLHGSFSDAQRARVIRTISEEIITAAGGRIDE